MYDDNDVGSTHALTPRAFIDDLKVLELSGVGSRACPNGLPEPRSGQRPFQEFYDELYFTRDAPRPQPQAAQKQGQGQGTGQGQRQQQGRLTRPSPIPSYASGASDSHGSGGEKEKKKKRGLFHF